MKVQPKLSPAIATTPAPEAGASKAESAAEKHFAEVEQFEQFESRFEDFSDKADNLRLKSFSKLGSKLASKTDSRAMKSALWNQTMSLAAQTTLSPVAAAVELVSLAPGRELAPAALDTLVKSGDLESPFTKAVKDHGSPELSRHLLKLESGNEELSDFEKARELMRDCPKRQGPQIRLGKALLKTLAKNGGNPNYQLALTMMKGKKSFEHVPKDLGSQDLKLWSRSGDLMVIESFLSGEEPVTRRDGANKVKDVVKQGVSIEAGRRALRFFKEHGSEADRQAGVLAEDRLAALAKRYDFANRKTKHYLQNAPNMSEILTTALDKIGVSSSQLSGQQVDEIVQGDRGVTERVVTHLSLASGQPEPPKTDSTDWEHKSQEMDATNWSGISQGSLLTNFHSASHMVKKGANALGAAAFGAFTTAVPGLAFPLSDTFVVEEDSSKLRKTSSKVANLGQGLGLGVGALALVAGSTAMAPLLAASAACFGLAGVCGAVAGASERWEALSNPHFNWG